MHAILLMAALAGDHPDQASTRQGSAYGLALTPAYYGYARPYFAPSPRLSIDLDFRRQRFAVPRLSRPPRRPQLRLRLDFPERGYSSPYSLPRGGYGDPYCGPWGCPR
jgi:hypothetical protein